MAWISNTYFREACFRRRLAALSIKTRDKQLPGHLPWSTTFPRLSGRNIESPDNHSMKISGLDPGQGRKPLSPAALPYKTCNRLDRREINNHTLKLPTIVFSSTAICCKPAELLWTCLPLSEIFVAERFTLPISSVIVPATAEL